jgi:quercetin dioxygenase-like cupin family protein
MTARTRSWAVLASAGAAHCKDRYGLVQRFFKYAPLALPLLLATAAAAWLPASAPSAVRWIADLCSAAARPMFASALSEPGAQDRPAVIVRPLSCEALPNVPGKNATTLEVVFPPGARSAPHRHPGSVMAVVVEGTVRSQLEGGPVVDYHAGQSFFEPPYILHMRAENPDPARTARLMAFFVTDENCGPLTIPVGTD